MLSFFFGPFFLDYVDFPYSVCTKKQGREEERKVRNRGFVRRL